MLEQDVIAAVQRHKSRAANPGRKLSSGFERRDGILRAVKDERWRPHLAEEVRHVDHRSLLLPSCGVLRRNGSAMELAKPLHLLRSCVGDEERCEHATES